LPEILIALRAVFGQDEVGHGTTRYRVGSDGGLRVPPEVARYLVRNGGFALDKPTNPQAAGSGAQHPGSQSLVRVFHPSANACSYRGRTYRGDLSGYFLVPADAVAELRGHGFAAIPPGSSPLNGPKGGTSASLSKPGGPDAQWPA
jgi:hypothetical protein